MLTEQQKNKYLTRINFFENIDNNEERLKALHLTHLTKVPFENLDISLGNPIELVPNLIYDKVVNRFRGGFCYELNYAFYLLLQSFGYEVSLLSAQVHNGSEYGQPFDHLLLLVKLNNQAVIADVGFGDSFLTPVSIDGTVHREDYASYKVIKDKANLLLLKKSEDKEWQPQYKFTTEPRQLTDFAAMCHFHQTSPESHFTQKSVCTIAKPNGRITITNQKLIETINNKKQESTIETDKEHAVLLKKYFAIEL